MGTGIAPRTPHGPGRAHLTHPVLASSDNAHAAERIGIVTEQSIIGPSKDWRAFQKKDRPNSLHRMSLYDGPPEQMAALKPDNGDENAPPVWTLGRLPTGRQHWIVCHYDDTSVTLARALPESVRQCRVTFKKAPYREIESLICQP